MLSVPPKDDNQSGYPPFHSASDSCTAFKVQRFPASQGLPAFGNFLGTGWFPITRCPRPLWRLARRNGWRQRVVGWLSDSGRALRVLLTRGAGSCEYARLGISSLVQKEIVEWRAIAVTPDVFREFYVRSLLISYLGSNHCLHTFGNILEDTSQFLTS